MRTFVVGAAAILLLGIVVVVVIILESPTPRPGPDGGALLPEADSQAPAAAPPLPHAGTITAPIQQPAVAVVQDPPPPQPVEGTWEAVPPAARASALGAVGAAVGRELNELQPRVAACFDEDTQARHGLTAYTVTQDSAPVQDTGTTILMLQIETFAGGARIVDAPVEARGRASDGLLACVQRVLRGLSVAVPEAKPGDRHRLLFPLLQ